jgi:hypothetical protein
MPKTSPDYEAEETDLEEYLFLDEEEFKKLLVLENGPTVKPRDRRTIRGELCERCLETMLSNPNLSCLRDSNASACRRCLEHGKKCLKVSNVE